MSASFLHGTEVIEANSGPRTIRTARTGVIGIIGTAPDAAPAETASIVLGDENDKYLKLTSTTSGADGNSVSLLVVAPDDLSVTSNGDLEIDLDLKRVKLTLPVTTVGQVESRYPSVVGILDTDPSVAALFSYESTTDDGSADPEWNYPRVGERVFLEGGADEPFPLDKPVLIPGTSSSLDALGDRGSLPVNLRALFKITTPLIIVIRVQQLAPDDPYSFVADKIPEFVNAESETGYKPKILIAPGYSHVESTPFQRGPVASALSTVADRLLAFAYIDLENEGGVAQTNILRYSDVYGDRRLALCYPQATEFRDGSLQGVWQSTIWAGITALTDLEKGFSRSPSNILVKSIAGLAEPVSFSLGDPNSFANLLNEKNICTIVRNQGFRTWGNRGTSADPKFKFITVVRTNDAIKESIQRAHLYAVDNKISRNYIESVVGGVKSYINQLRISEQIVNGNAWFDEELNPIDRLRDGWVHISYDFAPYYPAERLTFVSSINDEYIREIFA